MKKRIISAIIGLIIIIPLILLGGYIFSAAICLIATLAYKELLDLKKSHQEYPIIMAFLGFFCMVSIILSNYVDVFLMDGISYKVLVLLFLFLVLPVIFFEKDKYLSKDAFYLVGISLLLGIVFNLFIVIRTNGLYLFLYLLIIPMVTDIFAMLTGNYLGKHKMCPKLSPKKTWEGSLGGLIGGSVVGLIFYTIFINNLTIKVIVITIVLSIVGQMGDLVMSKIKRENEIKDFSNLIPGHGGILDRIDSIIFVFLAYMFLL